MHHVHKLKEHRCVPHCDRIIIADDRSNTTACKILDDLIHVRLFQEENQTWLEKAVMMRIWIATTTNLADNVLEQLQELLDAVTQNTKGPFSAPATHAAQTVSDTAR